MIRLSVPGNLRYRDLVLRVVASACRLLRPQRATKQETSRDTEAADFDDQVVSAVGEAFNNVAIHAYRGRSAGAVDIELEVGDDGVTVRLRDTGKSYDPTRTPTPTLDLLPESNMGLYLMRACMDHVSYRPGNPPAEPNVLTMRKRYPARLRDAGTAD
jgi:serine/threonine-protein kinase RsbW